MFSLKVKLVVTEMVMLRRATIMMIAQTLRISMVTAVVMSVGRFHFMSNQPSIIFYRELNQSLSQQKEKPKMQKLQQ